MGTSLVLVHGRSFKPKRNQLKRLWLRALRWGIRRDYSQQKVDAFDAASKEFVYFGDISNAFLKQRLGTSPPDDIRDRRECLRRLTRWFASDFNRRNYEALPGKDALKEAVADVFAGPLSLLRASDWIIEKVAPDMREYWNFDSEFGSEVRYRMIAPLKRAMNRAVSRDDQVVVVSHSLGTMIAYDTFWKFCHYGEYRPAYTGKKIHLWITLGAPLGDETVKRHLKGAGVSGARRYPNNVLDWVNVAAEDDYICHDQNVANDYREMLSLDLIRSIKDKRIYNLAVRSEQSNPHNSVGYLIHPVVAKAVADRL